MNMDTIKLIETRSNKGDVQHEGEEEYGQLLASLPKERGWRTSHLYLYQGFWCQPMEIQAITSMQKHFQARGSDILLATIPKSGTTWLKALVFSVINRKRFPVDLKNHCHHPLFTSNPHDLVPFLEYKLYANNQMPELEHMPSPRVFGTHVPFKSLPGSSATILNSKIVYICRNPFDTFTSAWHFITKHRPQAIEALSLDEAFDMYCRGVIGFGPYWDHMLGYWNESLENPNNVLFLKYDDMKEDICFHLKRLARFLGCAFTLEEESEGLVQDLAKLCSFEKLQGLEVNKEGRSIASFENKHLFRKGEVGDWVNLLTEEMAERLSKVMEEKLGDSGLSFKVGI